MEYRERYSRVRRMSKLFDKESLSKMSKKERVAIISQIVAIFFSFLLLLVL